LFFEQADRAEVAAITGELDLVLDVPLQRQKLVNFPLIFGALAFRFRDVVELTLDVRENLALFRQEIDARFLGFSRDEGRPAFDFATLLGQLKPAAFDQFVDALGLLLVVEAASTTITTPASAARSPASSPSRRPNTCSRGATTRWLTI
jgi:hypothetical protein